MKSLFNPKWILLVNTLPIAILFFIYFGEFDIIKSLLKPENISLWKTFGISLAILGILNFLYAIFLILRKKEVSYIYGIATLFTYIAFLYLYGNYADKIVPFSIPRWMIPENSLVYAFTFLMPTLAYAFFILVAFSVKDANDQKFWKSILIAIAIPLFAYLVSQLREFLWNSFGRDFWKIFANDFIIHAILITAITATLLFLFLLVRGVYILSLKKAEIWQKYQLAWKIPVSIVLPLLGLAVNNGILFKSFGGQNFGIFGDFSGIWFYILAVLNGIFICLPNLENKIYRIIVFIGRSLTFAYTFYFFLVFLPFLPLSIIAIIVVGTGFLMLAPLLLFVIHVNELSKDFAFLHSFLSGKIITLISVICFLVLPSYITLKYIKDKIVLNEALEYLYTPDYSKRYTIDKVSLSATLKLVKGHKENNRGGIFGSQIPYLSSYFNWLVLDNLTLSDTKINSIEKVFYGKGSFNPSENNVRKDSVSITKINSKSTFDKRQNAWISHVDLEITNHSTGSGTFEYATTIDLPAGCWISDYYLFIGNKKEYGVLAEKKTAMWVYSNIRNENKDPGIIYYLSGNRVAFKVFPFAENEVRRTGIEFIHKDPVLLKIDSFQLNLGTVEEQPSSSKTTDSANNVVYVSAREKGALPVVNRIPYYYFILDVSKGKEALKSKYISRIEALLNKNLIDKTKAEICFSNAFSEAIPLNEDWKKRLDEEVCEGGFYLDRSIRKELLTTLNSRNNSYPVVVTVTDSLRNAIIENDFSDMKIAFPESDLFYNLTGNGGLEPHSLYSNPKNECMDSLGLKFSQTVLAFPDAVNPVAWLPDNKQASILLKNLKFDIPASEMREKNWQSALSLHGKWISQVFHPEISAKEWPDLVKSSFETKILSPVTSYLVVENEAQKAILKKKQKQVLSSNKSLDLGEDTQRMSEPGLTLIGIILILVWWYKKNYQNKSLLGRDKVLLLFKTHIE